MLEADFLTRNPPINPLTTADIHLQNQIVLQPVEFIMFLVSASS